jgi:hypothetical protein
MNAVSTFGDVEDSWNVHYRKLLTIVNELGTSLTAELSRGLKEMKALLISMELVDNIL